MPVRDYINRMRPKTPDIWKRDPWGDLFDTSQHSRKLRNQGRAGQGLPYNERKRVNRDPRIAQWDWLYGGKKRPTITDEYNPRMGTLGGVPSFLEKWNSRVEELKKSSKDNPYSALAGSENVGGASRGKSRGPSGKSTGSITNTGGRYSGNRPGSRDNVWSPPGIGGSGSIGGGQSNRQVRGDPRGPSRPDQGDTIGAPITPEYQAMIDLFPEMWAEIAGQSGALLNEGYMGSAGLENIFTQFEEPENRLLDALPGRTADLINQGKLSTADAARSLTRGAPKTVGRRPGRGAELISEALVPMKTDQAAHERDLINQAYSIADSIDLGRGARRAGYLDKNMASKTGGIPLLSNAIGQGGNLTTGRIWDTEDPANKALTIQDDAQDYGEDMARLNQLFNRDNMRLSDTLTKNRMRYQAMLNDWMQARGYDRQSSDGFMDFVNLGLKIMEKIPGPWQAPAVVADAVVRS